MNEWDVCGWLNSASLSFSIVQLTNRAINNRARLTWSGLAAKVVHKWKLKQRACYRAMEILKQKLFVNETNLIKTSADREDFCASEKESLSFYWEQ